MVEVQPCTSRGEDTVERVGEASCSGADGSSNPESIPPSIATAESPSFLTWIWIQILTACSGVRGVRGGGLSGLASGAQHSLESSESEVLSRIAASKSAWSEVPGREIHHSVESEVLSKIAASKSTWSEVPEVPGRDIHHSVSVPDPSQLSVWEELKASVPHFFSDDWARSLELGQLIGEGGQAQIFEAKVKGMKDDLVLKVFKLEAGFSLEDLKRHWPRTMRKGGEDCSESMSGQERSFGFVFDYCEAIVMGFRCFIMGATLLKDGRFAFLMWRYWGDLRTLIDLKVEDNTHPWEFDLLSRNRRNQPPFSFGDTIQIMLQIAFGMLGLHTEGVLHRDLKAANVLIKVPRADPIFCDVADYECAMFVQGTRFWRAPEVLQELQKNKEDRNGEIWTEKVDVYSFGMTCYEILTGQIPFDGYTKSKWGDVIKGDRPSLPDHVIPPLQELVEACWHAQPSKRPSFDFILEKLDFLKRDIELGIR